MGAGSLLAHTVNQGKTGEFSYGMIAFMNTELGSADTAGLIHGQDLLAVGNQKGEVCFVKGSALAGEPTASSVFSP